LVSFSAFLVLLKSRAVTGPLHGVNNTKVVPARAQVHQAA